jgi:hypothetical protein
MTAARDTNSEVLIPIAPEPLTEKRARVCNGNVRWFVGARRRSTCESPEGNFREWCVVAYGLAMAG